MLVLVTFPTYGLRLRYLDDVADIVDGPHTVWSGRLRAARFAEGDGVWQRPELGGLVIDCPELAPAPRALLRVFRIHVKRGGQVLLNVIAVAARARGARE